MKVKLTNMCMVYDGDRKELTKNDHLSEFDYRKCKNGWVKEFY